MKVEYSREAAPVETAGGFIGGFKKPAEPSIQTMVAELPDGSPIPDGARQVDDATPVHDWQ